MTVINTINQLRKFEWSSYAWPWPYEPFVELASKPQTEFLISKAGFGLCRKSILKQTLPEKPSIHTMEDVCSSLNASESVVLSIGEEMCFVQQLEVPARAMNKITSILDFELTKTTPFTKDQVFTGWTSQVSKASPNLRHVTHYVVRRDLLAKCMSALSSQGAKVHAIVVRQKDGHCAPFALSPSGEDFASDHAKLWMKAAIVSATAMVLGAVLLIGAVLFNQSKTSNFIETSTGAFAEDAGFVRKQLDVLQASHSEIGALLTKDSTSTKKSLVIEEISKILTNDSYLDGLSIHGNDVIMDGAAANPEGLISLLEASSLFKDVTFNTPSFRNPGEVNSRFSIKLSIAKDGA